MKSFFAAILLSAVLSVPALAAPVTHTSVASFDIEVGSTPLQTEGFTGATLGGSVVGSFGGVDGFTTSLALNTRTLPGFNIVRTGGLFNSGGMNGRHLYVGMLGGDSFTITFDTAVTAFGAMFAGVNNAVRRLPNALRSELYIDGVKSTWLDITADNEDGRFARFFGITSSTAFSKIEFRGLPATEAFGLDDVRWARAAQPTPVPLPASGVLLLGAMLAAGLFGRRRARA